MTWGAGGATGALVIEVVGAHNRPGPHGVLQPLMIRLAMPSITTLNMFPPGRLDAFITLEPGAPDILTLLANIQPPMTAQETSAISALPIMSEAAHQTYPISTLYVVATPIGNVADITLRALHVLTLVNAVACEDTRNTGHLLTRFGISKPLIAAHQHNEREVATALIARLQAGERIALVSDAGTPAISDPGARIVDAVRAAGLRVVPLPGASAVVTAISAGGLVNDQFHFIGFLPAKASARDTVLQSLKSSSATLVFYEAPHRIQDCARALAAVFEPTRQVVFARELTKMFEEIHRCPLSDALAWLAQDAHREKGEFVVLLEGATEPADAEEVEAERILNILLLECSVKQAASLAAAITGRKKNALYQRALELKAQSSD
jgi:16S rRNA (cytidine1402-2'-O)-methyltransferase